MLNYSSPFRQIILFQIDLSLYYELAVLILWVCMMNFVSDYFSPLIFLLVLLIGRLRPVTPYIGSVPAARGSYVGSIGYQQPLPYSYQQGFVYPSSYGWVLIYTCMLYKGMLASCCLSVGMLMLLTFISRRLGNILRIFSHISCLYIINHTV